MKSVARIEIKYGSYEIEIVTEFFGERDEVYERTCPIFVPCIKSSDIDVLNINTNENYKRLSVWLIKEEFYPKKIMSDKYGLHRVEWWERD